MIKELEKKYGLNNEQALVVMDTSKELIVPAGAGSGKTKTLVTKVVNLLKSGSDLDEFLVLTFTNKAAAEMKERIKKELINENMDQMANKIDSSNISTFDAFALNFVKQNASKINLDANIELLDGAVFEIIKKDILNDIIVSIMLDEERNKSLYDFLVLYTDKYGEENLYKELLQTYNGLSELGFISSLKVDDLVKTENFFDSLNLKEKIENISDIFTDEYKDFLDILYLMYDYLDGLKKDKPEVEIPKIAWKKLGIDDLSKTKINKVLDMPKAIIKADLERNDVLEFYSLKKVAVKNILEILKIYEERINEFKYNTNKFEFNDIANFLNKILRENTSALKRLKEKFKYVFVDEYQDTSKVQSDFLEMLIEDNNDINVLYVGDLKQSIYKFRNAKPETFIEKLNTVNKIPLLANYRSSKKIIDFVNNVFTTILDDEVKYDINYKDGHFMESRSKRFDESDVLADVFIEEIYSLDRSKVKTDVLEEAFTIGNKIIELIKTGKVSKYSDIAILARNKAAFKKISDVFKFLNIPIEFQVDQSLKQTYFLKLMANILKLSATIFDKNKTKEKKFYYFSVARSELFRFSDYKLFNNLIDIENNTKRLIIDEEIKEKAIRLNNFIKTKSNFEIIDCLVNEFDLYNKITKTTKSKEKELQIEYLYKLSKSLSDLSINSFDFVDYIYDIAYNEDIDLKVSVLTDESEDSVKITNIHQSKGLEYNTLFVIGLNNKFNNGNFKKFVYNNKTNFNINLKLSDDYINKTKIDIVAKQNKEYLKEVLKKENLKEELRLLYVALTRAEKALYLVVTPKDDYSELNSFTDYLYSANMLKYINTENIKSYESFNKNEDYYLKLKENKLYYSKELENLEEVNLNISNQLVSKKKASLEIVKLISIDEKNKLNAGTKMHLDFEYRNTNNKLVSSFYETKFNNKDFKDAKIYYELEYTYIENDIVYNGIIDMVALYDDQVHVIDYKLKNNDSKIYKKQLENYKAYLSKIFDLPIKMFIYSVIKKEYEEIK